jgi:hypothetical protein
MMARPQPALAALLGLALLAGPGLAQSRPGNGCPLIVPASQAELQPLRIRPHQVAGKNARGCLSPADAIYGPDGCPRQLCGANAGVIQLPPPLP